MKKVIARYGHKVNAVPEAERATRETGVKHFYEFNTGMWLWEVFFEDQESPKTEPIMEPSVTYTVWCDSKGTKRRIVGGHVKPKWPHQFAKEYNNEEAANAEAEHRSVRNRFFVVEETITYKEVEPSDD